MKYLVIDTSGEDASVSLFEDDVLISTNHIQNLLKHAQTLMPMIDEVLDTTPIKNIDEIHICEGPGSFTGVRVGLATAFGLAKPFQLPVIGFTSHSLMYQTFLSQGGSIDDEEITIIDAKREEYHYFNHHTKAQSLIGIDELQKLSTEKTLIALENHKDGLGEFENIKFVRLDTKYYKRQSTKQAQPFYARSSQAEENKGKL